MEVKELYAKLDGNYEEALHRMMNDGFIGRMVLKFKDNNNCQQLLDDISREDMAAVFATSHALKGVAGNLAFTSLFDISSKICEKTRNIKEGEKVDLSSDALEFKEISSKVLKALEEFANN